MYMCECGVHSGGCGAGQRPWERPDQARSRRLWLLLRRLECISSSRKSSSRILIIFYFISVFCFTPPLLSSLSLLHYDFILPLHHFSTLSESDCLLCEIVVHSLFALSLSLLQQSHLPLSNFTLVSVSAIQSVSFLVALPLLNA